jgi:ADP-ribose pyrophosphatase YjhB (NUDIX family)
VINSILRVMKPTKEAVAIVVIDASGTFLTVQRADNDSFAGLWGLPAASPRNNETLHDSARRAAKDKLGVDVEIVNKVGDMTVDKGDYLEHLTEFQVKITSGAISLKRRDPSVSHYTAFKYTNDPAILVPAAQHGSICSRIFLRSKGIDWGNGPV